MAGYSGTPLAKKLGVKAGCRLRPEGAPPDYLELLAPLPENVTLPNNHEHDIDIWHLFMKSRDELKSRLLVDVKVCAVDQTWSGLKLVLRKENRK